MAQRNDGYGHLDAINKRIVREYPDNPPVGVIGLGTTVLIDGPESGEIIITKYSGKVMKTLK